MVIRLIGGLIGIYSLVLLFFAAVGEYFTIESLSELDNVEIVIGYPLFVYLSRYAGISIGFIVSYGLLRQKSWGVRVFNIFVAYILILHIIQILAYFSPGQGGSILIEASNGAIFYGSKIEWQSFAAMGVVILIFLILNCVHSNKRADRHHSV